jgi:transcriptional regulator with XRE-family HTH domain
MKSHKDEHNSRFGQCLRAIRLKRDLSQEELAGRATIDRTYISSCERGKRNVTLDIIYRLSEALEVSPKDLLPDPDEKVDA